ncbi:hypothetical protein ASF61_21755 [Duganella sp. Leaf126]|nr:hypothetical protein ASF61_21755 [Duganella sp. Leaf126]
MLTPAQQAEADRQRILSQLESGKAGAPAVRRKRPRTLWLGAAVVCLAIAVIAGLWWWSDADSAPNPSSATAAAADTPAAAGNSAASDVSSEEVLASAPPAAVIQEDHAARAQDKQQSLSDMLDTPAHASDKPNGNELSKALESPSGPPAAAPHKPATSDKPKHKPKTNPTVAKSPRAEEKTKTSPEEENDVALLAALVAHTQSEREADPAPAKPRRLSLDEQIAQCNKFSKTKAAHCRERVCDGRSKTGACKVHK